LALLNPATRNDVVISGGRLTITKSLRRWFRFVSNGIRNIGHGHLRSDDRGPLDPSHADDSACDSGLDGIASATTTQALWTESGERERNLL